jgi:hypothetical protein
MAFEVADSTTEVLIQIREDFTFEATEQFMVIAFLEGPVFSGRVKINSNSVNISIADNDIRPSRWQTYFLG